MPYDLGYSYQYAQADLHAEDDEGGDGAAHELVPLYPFSNINATDHVASTFSPAKPGYELVRQMGYVYTPNRTQPPGTELSLVASALSLFHSRAAPPPLSRYCAPPAVLLSAEPRPLHNGLVNR